MIKNRNMKKGLIYFFFASLVFVACSKSEDSPAPTPPAPTPEATIAFSIDPDSLGASQSIAVNISSTLPTTGVTIDVKTTKDSDGSTVSSSSVASTTAKNTISVDNLTAGVLCTTTITVASKSKADNSALKSFKIARK
ncbi:MAG: hypothetical protein RL621_1058 [Bacteroidota bacterium]|jgi:uncharacterized protein YcfL